MQKLLIRTPEGQLTPLVRSSRFQGILSEELCMKVFDTITCDAKRPIQKIKDNCLIDAQIIFFSKLKHQEPGNLWFYSVEKNFDQD